MDVKELTEKFSELETKQAEIVKQHEAEIEAKQAEFEAKEKEFEDFKKSVEEDKEKVEAEKKDAIELAEKKLADELEKHEQEIAKIKSAMNRPTIDGNKGEEMSEKSTWEVEKKELASKLRGQKNGEVINFETKVMSSDSNIDGGYTTSGTMSDMIIEVARETSEFRQYAGVETVDGPYLEILVNKHGGSTGGWVSERTDRSKTDTAQLELVQIHVAEQYAQPAVTNVLIQDSKIDIVEYVRNEAGKDLADDQDVAWITGDGVGKPRGILTYDAGTAWGQIEQLTTSTASTILYADLVDLISLPKNKYRAGAVAVMNRKTRYALKKIVDENKNQILYPANTGGPMTLMGYPIVENENMPDIADGALPIAFGDLGQGYKIVDRSGAQIIADSLTEKGKTLFYTSIRVGGQVVNFEAIKLLKVKSA